MSHNELRCVVDNVIKKHRFEKDQKSACSIMKIMKMRYKNIDSKETSAVIYALLEGK
ncbi:MAG: hypothetical protein IBX45_05420 [Campylobacterales bacterium]|nr:hypothetical protein [Campylobacterales bacterium]